MEAVCLPAICFSNQPEGAIHFKNWMMMQLSCCSRSKYLDNVGPSLPGRIELPVMHCLLEEILQMQLDLVCVHTWITLLFL